MTRTDECVFCKIVEMELPAHRVFENKTVIAFLDIKPLNPGHTLVIPKKHYRWVWDIPDVGEYFEYVRHVARGLQKAMKTEMIVSGISGIGESKWMHAHTHLVPRFPADGHGDFVDSQNAKDIPSEEMRNLEGTIREALRKFPPKGRV